jgi:hypothetical protein
LPKLGNNVQDLQDIVTDPELRGALLASLLGIVVGAVFGVLVHEAGHAIAARLAGYRIRLIRIGRGPELFRIHLGLALLVWRLITISGAVAIVRHARLMLIAGGGVANALVASSRLCLSSRPVGFSTCSSSLVLVGLSRLMAVYSGQRYDFRPPCRIASSCAYTRPR